MLIVIFFTLNKLVSRFENAWMGTSPLLQSWTLTSWCPPTPDFWTVHVIHKLLNTTSEHIRWVFQIAYQLVTESRQFLAITSTWTVLQLSLPFLLSSTPFHLEASAFISLIQILQLTKVTLLDKSSGFLSLFTLVMKLKVGLSGLGIMCSPQDPRFTGSNPAKVDGFFLGRKNPEYKSSGKDFKLGVQSLRFQAR